jgi:hypothetical protein
MIGAHHLSNMITIETRRPQKSCPDLSIYSEAQVYMLSVLATPVNLPGKPLLSPNHGLHSMAAVVRMTWPWAGQCTLNVVSNRMI